MKKNLGYILPLTFMLTSASILLVSAILMRSSLFSKYTKVFYQREKAKNLARSGIEIAISQLSNLAPEEKESSENSQQATEKKDPKKEYYASLFSIIDRWQTFKVNESDFDVADAEIKIYIACEQGKINLGHLYDFKKDEFVSGDIDGKKTAEFIFTTLAQGEQKKLVEAFQNFMKKRSYPLQDISELLLAKEFAVFKNNLFPEYQEKNNSGLKEKKNKKKIYLMDLFTLETPSVKIDPLVLSESASTLFGFDRQSTINGKQWVKDLPTGTINWSSDWNKVLSPLYKKEYEALSQEAKNLLTLQSNSLIFSVIVQVNVGKLTQKMYAILHNDKKLNHYKIQKLYWL